MPRLRLRNPSKAVIFVTLHERPSHSDPDDSESDAPVAYRGEGKPFKSNVPGFDLFKLMPRQATSALDGKGRCP